MVYSHVLFYGVDNQLNCVYIIIWIMIYLKSLGSCKKNWKFIHVTKNIVG